VDAQCFVSGDEFALVDRLTCRKRLSDRGENHAKSSGKKIVAPAAVRRQPRHRRSRAVMRGNPRSHRSADALDNLAAEFPAWLRPPTRRYPEHWSIWRAMRPDVLILAAGAMTPTHSFELDWDEFPSTGTWMKASFLFCKALLRPRFHAARRSF
jgi:hypothetical protein